MIKDQKKLNLLEMNMKESIISNMKKLDLSRKSNFYNISAQGKCKMLEDEMQKN